MKTYTDEALSRAVYGIAAERMQQAGAEMPCSEDVFAVLTAAQPDAVRYDEIAALGNAEAVNCDHAVTVIKHRRRLSLHRRRF